MKKNVVKILLLVLILVLGILLQDKTQNYNILVKISKATRQITEENKNLQIRVTEKYNNGAEKIAETYIKDGIIVTRRIDGKNSPSNSIEWSTNNKDVIFNSCYEYEFDYEDNVVKGLNCYYNHDVNSNNQISTRKSVGNLLLMYDKDVPYSSGYSKINIFNMPKIEESEYKGKKCYALKTEYKTWFVDKESLHTLAIECKVFENDSPCFYTFEYDIEAPEGIYDSPNASYYDSVIFQEVNYPLDKVYDDPNKEKAISGTELKPGEELIEIVEIADEEELNFLGLTENELGVKGFNIYTLETYNKFREKYSGLRELTKEDFQDYYVAIAYKDGYKLNNIQKVPSEESRSVNYVFNTEKTNKSSLVLIVTPRTKISSESKFIVSKEELKISESDAIKIVNDNIKEIKDNMSLVLDEDNYVNVEFSEIEILDNSEFAILDYIQTPVKGKETMCWCISMIDDKNKLLDIYVNIMTGEMIGAVSRTL